MNSHFTEKLHYFSRLFSFIILEKFHLQKTYSLLTVLLFFLLTLPSFSQPSSASVFFIDAGAGFVQGNCEVLLEDSTGIQSVELILTDLMSKEVLFNQEYIFDQTSGLPSGTSWMREGTKVTLGLSTLPKKLAWQGAIRLKNNSGQWSSPFVFLFN